MDSPLTSLTTPTDALAHLRSDRDVAAAADRAGYDAARATAAAREATDTARLNRRMALRHHMEGVFGRNRRVQFADGVAVRSGS